MSFDIATLAVEVDATPVTKAADALDRFVASSERAQGTTRQTRTATEQANAAHSVAVQQLKDLLGGTNAYSRAQAEGIGLTTRATSSVSQLTEQRRLNAAAMRELVTATRAYERDQTAAANAVARAQAAADRQAEESAQQVLTLRMRLAKQRASEEAAAANAAQAAQDAEDRAAEASAQQVFAFRVRMARQRASEEAAEAKAVEVAQAAADRAAERSAEQVFAFRMRMARQRAAEEAAEIKATEAAQLAADRAAEQSAQQSFAFRSRMWAQQAREEAAAASEQARAVAALQASVDPLGAAQARVNAEMASAQKLYAEGAISAEDYQRATTVLNARLAGLSDAQTKGVGSTKALTYAGLNLSRQFADIGVTAAMGMKPWMILIQQGPQIADVFETAKIQGYGFWDVLKGLGVQMGLLKVVSAEQAAANSAVATTAAAASVAEGALGAAEGAAATEAQAATAAAAELAAANTAVARTATAAAAAESVALAPLGVLVGVLAVTAVGAFGAAELAARNLNKENGKVVDGLDLTQKQLQHLKDKGTDTGVTLIDVFKGTWTYFMKGASDALGPVGKWFSDLFDKITVGLVGAIKAIVGGFAGAFAEVKVLWSQLPQIMGDAAITAANGVISAFQGMTNWMIDRLNSFGAQANDISHRLGHGDVFGSLDHVSGGQLANPYAASTTKALADAAAAGKAAADEAAKGVDGFLAGWGKAITDAAKARITKAAGHGKDPKTHTPRDMTDEETARIAQMLEEAKASELQAQLAITANATDRARIEHDILTAETAAKQAGIDKQIAAINDPKNVGLDAAKKAELTGELEVVKAINNRVASLKGQAIDESLRVSLVHETAAREQDALDLQEERLKASASLLKSDYARAVAEVDILKIDQQLQLSKAQEAVDAARIGSTERERAEAALQRLKIEQDAATKLAKEQTSLLKGIEDATDAVDSFKDALKRHDWARVFDEFQRTIQAIEASFAANGLTGGLMTAGSAAATLIGGKTGNAIGTGIGIAGLGSAIGSALSSGTIAAGIANGIAGLGGSAALAGSIGSGLIAAGAVLGPVALAAGAAYALAKIMGVGGKPTNAGAGYDLVTGQISGNKRTDATEQAATGAGQAILQGEELLRQAGITLATTVTGLVIGTRDLTDIQLSNGKHLTSAVGDAAAATDTALKAVLEGATYTSDAQKQLVQSMVAAGKGFDDITAALQNYAAAQQISAALSDQILQLTDPKAYDLQSVHRAIADQRKAAQDAAIAGYLTADQLAGINAQLSTLEGLQIDQVMQRYADAVNDSTDILQAAKDAAAAQLSDAQNAVSTARDALTASYQAQQQAIQATEQKFQAFADSLSDFSKQLATGDLAALDPMKQYAATRAEFMRLSALPAADEERLANLQTASQAFLAASKAVAPTQLAYNQDLAAVRFATDASAKAASDQVDVAEQQLKALDAQVAGLITVNQSVLSVEAAVLGLNGALAALAAAQAVSNAAGPQASNDNFDAAQYLADNKDIGRAYSGYASGAYTYGLPAGMTEDQFALYHYLTTGQNEIASGLRKFATGGSFMVGGVGGTDSQLVQFMASPDERVTIETPAQQNSSQSSGNADLVAEVRALRAEVSMLHGDAKTTANSTKKLADQFENVSNSGNAVKTEAA